VTLAEVVGHERQKAVLRGGIERDAVGNAYLFSGPPGVGKGAAAVQFGRALLCLKEEGDACGECESCRCTTAGHPDFHVFAPEKGKKVLKIDQVRDMQHLLALSPSLGRRKVAVIDPAEAVNISSANILLKMLEEPPEGTVFLLVASNQGALPATVLSRCRKVSFGQLDEGEVREVLLRQGWDEAEAAAAAGLSEGSPGLAMSVESDAWKKALTVLDAMLGAGSTGAVLEQVEKRVQDRTEAEFVTRILLSRARSEMRRRLGLGGAGRENTALEHMGEGELLRLSADLVKTSRLLESNVNVKLALGSLFSAWAGSFARESREGVPGKGKTKRR
jgi:DNA polymerase-3 subunit delta'